MTSYILHVSLLLGLGFILYQVLLKKETFYSLNRMILSSYLILAFSLPLIQIPQSWSLQSAKILSPIEVLYKPTNKLSIPNPQLELKPKELLSNNSIPETPTIDANDNPENFTSDQLTNNEETSSLSEGWIQGIKSINWFNAFKWIYLIGLGIFFINFLVQLSILIYYRIKFPILKDGKLTIVEMEGDKSPFSFLNMIYINPNKYDYDTYQQILAHEKIHITKWHSIDIFLSEIALMVLWFNPFAWLYRKIVEHNLEYLTDQEMLASGANAEVYQMNLLKVSVPELPLSLSTNYNQSFLKKRIHMMQAKKSSARSTWKYLFILPVLGITVLLFNPTFVSGQNIKTQNEQQDNSNSSIMLVLPESSDLDKPELNIVFPKDNFKTKPDKLSDLAQSDIQFFGTVKIDPSTILELSIFDIKKNEEFTMTQTKDGFSIVSSKGRTFRITKEKTVTTSYEEDIEDQGNWEAEIRDNSVCLFIKKGGEAENYFWSSNEFFLSSDFSTKIIENVEGKFSLKREPGTLVLEGEFTDGKGTGRYTFTPNAEFVNVAKREGYNISEDNLIHFFLSGINASYFNGMKSNGYAGLNENELLSMAIHDVNEDYIMKINAEFKKANYIKPSAEELVALKIHDVDMSYIKCFAKELYENLTVDQIVSAAIHDVDSKFIADFKTLEFPDLSFDNLISAANHGVDVDYIKQLKSAGFKDLSFADVTTANFYEIDPNFIREVKSVGLTNISFDDIINFRIHNIDIDVIHGLRDLGFDLDPGDLINAKTHDVTPKFIKSMQEKGYKDLSFDEYLDLKYYGFK